VFARRSKALMRFIVLKRFPRFQHTELCASCVLLVDDDPSMRGLLSRYLGRAGLEALHAEDGIDAVVKLRKVVPRVIICDLQMPRMAGLEFIGVVRRRFPTLPVVAISGGTPCEFPEELKPDRYFERIFDYFLNSCEPCMSWLEKLPIILTSRK